MSKRQGYYRPEDPEKGDLIFLSEAWAIDLQKKEELQEKAGIITRRGNPTIHRGIHQYEIEIKLANGSTVKGFSRDWKCLKTLQNMTSSHLQYQKELIQKLERLIEKPKSQSPKQTNTGPEPEM